MALSVSQLRQAVATQVKTLSGFTESHIPPDYFGRNENSVAHKRFAVQMSTSNAMVERQRRTIGVMMESVVRVKFAYRLRPKDAYPTDYDLAMNIEQDVINAVIANYAAVRPEVEIRYSRTVRDITDSTEYMLFDIEFNAYHTIPT
jgi:uncharacterized protein (DUF1015 family)